MNRNCFSQFHYTVRLRSWFGKTVLRRGRAGRGRQSAEGRKEGKKEGSGGGGGVDKDRCFCLYASVCVTNETICKGPGRTCGCLLLLLLLHSIAGTKAFELVRLAKHGEIVENQSPTLIDILFFSFLPFYTITSHSNRPIWMRFDVPGVETVITIIDTIRASVSAMVSAVISVVLRLVALMIAFNLFLTIR
jgi:hypothetical protein